MVLAAVQAARNGVTLCCGGDVTLVRCLRCFCDAFAMLLRCCCDALGASVKSVCVNSEAAEAPGFPVVLQICLSLTRNSRVTAMWSRTAARQSKRALMLEAPAIELALCGISPAEPQDFGILAFRYAADFLRKDPAFVQEASTQAMLHFSLQELKKGVQAPLSPPVLYILSIQIKWRERVARLTPGLTLLILIGFSEFSDVLKLTLLRHPQIQSLAWLR